MTLKNFYETFINEDSYIRVFAIGRNSNTELDSDFFMYYENVEVYKINAKGNKFIIEVFTNDETIEEFKV